MEIKNNGPENESNMSHEMTPKMSPKMTQNTFHK